MRNLCIFLHFLKVTYTNFVLGNIDFKKKCKNLAHLGENTISGLYVSGNKAFYFSCGEMVPKFLRIFRQFDLVFFCKLIVVDNVRLRSLEEGKMRDLCIYLKFLMVTYTNFVLGNIDFKKSVRIWLILQKEPSRSCE